MKRLAILLFLLTATTAQAGTTTLSIYEIADGYTNTNAVADVKLIGATSTSVAHCLNKDFQLVGAYTPTGDYYIWDNMSPSTDPIEDGVYHLYAQTPSVGCEFFSSPAVYGYFYIEDELLTDEYISDPAHVTLTAPDDEHVFATTTATIEGEYYNPELKYDRLHVWIQLYDQTGFDYYTYNISTSTYGSISYDYLATTSTSTYKAYLTITDSDSFDNIQSNTIFFHIWDDVHDGDIDARERDKYGIQLDEWANCENFDFACQIGGLIYAQFVPDENQKERIKESIQEFKYKAPWGYFFLVYDDLQLLINTPTTEPSGAKLYMDFSTQSVIDRSSTQVLYWDWGAPYRLFGADRWLEWNGYISTLIWILSIWGLLRLILVSITMFNIGDYEKGHTTETSGQSLSAPPAKAYKTSSQNVEMRGYTRRDGRVTRL